MSSVTLLLIESTGIQSFIFGSNNLQQNIGASELVARSTSQWVVQELDRLHLTHNAAWDSALGDLVIRTRSAAAGEVAAEVVYAGGGNALLLFGANHGAQVVPFVRALTRRALREARGLGLVAAQISFDWAAESLADQLKQLREVAARQKRSRQGDAALPGLGVTANCDFTGLPAVDEDDVGRLIGQSVRHKLAATRDGNERLHAVLPEVKELGYEFVYDFDWFGQKGESSYIAVIHTDGNGMGKRLEALATTHRTAGQNAAYVAALRSFSQSIKDNARQALQSTVRLLLQSRDRDDLFGGVVPTPVRDNQEYLPFRPIVFGGDDVTFVCEGRLGLALAVHYLQRFADPKRPLSDGRPAYARGGVAIVPSHYPFARSYALAVELCKSAKAAAGKLIAADTAGATTLDWHFATTGMLLDLDALRDREYVAADRGSLLMRPVGLDAELVQAQTDGSWRSWSTFRDLVKAFQSGDGWSGRRNKVKALRDALRAGPAAVELFVQNYAPPVGGEARILPPIPHMEEMARRGWQQGQCGYFDAVEALDFFVELDAPKEQP